MKPVQKLLLLNIIAISSFVSFIDTNQAYSTEVTPTQTAVMFLDAVKKGDKVGAQKLMHPAAIGWDEGFAGLWNEIKLFDYTAIGERIKGDSAKVDFLFRNAKTGEERRDDVDLMKFRDTWFVTGL